MARILCICPSHRDHRELFLHAGDHELLFHDYASLDLEQLTVPGTVVSGGIGHPEREIDILLDRCRKERVDAVVSTDDYPGAALASAVAKEGGYVGPAPRASLLCQHKYHSRVIQSRAVPECVPHFELIDVRAQAAAPVAEFPLFLKPVKSFFSVGAARVDSHAQLERHVRRWRHAEAFFQPFDYMLRRYTGLAVGHGCLIAEGLLSGSHATLECYVYEGRAHALGLVDSVFHPGTLAFARFEYPSRLPAFVRERMLDAADRALAALGFDGGLANIEFLYDVDTDRLGIVEINPRMSSQFADLFEKVDGTNSYEILIDLAFGKRPKPKRSRGRHAAAASCVMRCFEDRLVQRVPTKADVAAAQRDWPDARVEVLADVGVRLSAQMQDECSFRYGIVNLGGGDQDYILSAFDEVRRKLPFVLDPVLTREARGDSTMPEAKGS